MENQGKSILIIEDDFSLLRILAEALHEQGFNVLTAENGEDGLALAKEKHPDLILLDIILPRMDGHEVLRNLREDSWGKTASVVILTVSEPNDATVREIAKYEPVFYLIKTHWQLDEIIEKIKEVFRKPQI